MIYESFNQQRFEEAIGRSVPFVQDNHSCSAKGVLRGLHYQWPRPQGKLVSVLEGEVYDVAVDIRRGSPTFGRWEAVLLSAGNHRQFWIPEGFAHGFLTVDEKKVSELPDAVVLEHPGWAAGHLGAAKVSDVNDPRFDFEKVVPETLAWLRSAGLDCGDCGVRRRC